MRKTLWDEIKGNVSDLFNPYDVNMDKFTSAMDVLSAPCAIVFQIIFWGYCITNELQELKDSSMVEKILMALWYAFGGVIFSVCIFVCLGIIAYILKKKPVGIISVILGAIGTLIILYFIW